MKKIRDKIGGWWRKLNQPLVSELPRPVIWVSLVFWFLFIMLFGSCMYYEHGALNEAIYGYQPYDLGDVPYFIVLAGILFYMAMDVVWLCFPNIKNRCLEQHESKVIENFTLMRPLANILGAILIGLLAYMLVAFMYGQYKSLEKDEVLLEAMRDGNLSLEDEWLKQRGIPTQQYAQRRQDIIDDGWDKTSELTANLKKGFASLIVFAASFFGMLFLRACADIYLIWRYYPRPKDTIVWRKNTL